MTNALILKAGSVFPDTMLNDVSESNSHGDMDARRLHHKDPGAWIVLFDSGQEENEKHTSDHEDETEINVRINLLTKNIQLHKEKKTVS